MVSLKQVFDEAWRHFIVQEGQPSVDLDESVGYDVGCYRDQDNNLCPIGLVLPDRLLNQFRFERPTLVARLYPEILDPWINWDVVLARLHDDLIRDGVWSCSPEDRRKLYRAAAASWGLAVPRQVGIWV